VGKKWVKMKSGSAVVKATGAYAWSYKATKKGTHRVTASIKGTSAYTAKSLVKTFKVK
jgi:predicted secreted protein